MRFLYTFVLTKNCHCTVKSFVDGAVLNIAACAGVEPLVVSFPHKAVQTGMGVPFKGPVWEIYAST